MFAGAVWLLRNVAVGTADAVVDVVLALEDWGVMDGAVVVLVERVSYFACREQFVALDRLPTRRFRTRRDRSWVLVL